MRRNLVLLERRSAEGKRERYLEIAAELVRLKTDVIVTIGTFMTPSSPRDYPRQAHEDAPRPCSGWGSSEDRREHRKDSSLVMRSPSQNRQACIADGRCQETGGARVRGRGASGARRSMRAARMACTVAAIVRCSTGRVSR